ncbi:hypothetical protein MKX01_018020, partial [Papaver californicum]
TRREYIEDDMKVSLQLYDGKVMSASMPPRVTCTNAEAKGNMKGLTATPQIYAMGGFDILILQY